MMVQRMSGFQNWRLPVRRMNARLFIIWLHWCNIWCGFGDFDSLTQWRISYSMLMTFRWHSIGSLPPPCWHHLCHCIFVNFFIIPIGMIFWAQNSPAFFTLLSKLHTCCQLHNLLWQWFSWESYCPHEMSSSFSSAQGKWALKLGASCAWHFSLRCLGWPAQSLQPQLNLCGW
jgi:hypothetical protein